jgi:hypothetical protein
MTYNIAVGMDNSTLNKIISEVYTSIYPNIFKSTIDIGQLGIASVGFDINVSPTVNFNPSSEIKSYFEDVLKTNKLGATSNLSTEDTSKIVEMAVAASFGTVTSIELTINYINGTSTSVNATLNAIINIQTSTEGGQNLLTVNAVSGTITTDPSEPILEGLLNNVFIPLLIPYLNNNILSPIKIPALQYGSLIVSLPVPVIQFPDLVTYSALGTMQPDIPAPSSWSSDCVFVAMDTAALTAAASIPFPLGPGTGFNWEIIDGRVEAQVHAPTNMQVNSDGSLSASIVADVLAQLTLHTPWPLPNVSFGPKAQASLAVTFKPSVDNGNVYIAIEGVPIPTFSFDWGIPSWINWLFYPLEAGLAAALNAILGPLIGNILKFPPIKVFTIPQISFSLAGQTINIMLDEATTSSKNSMLLIDTQVKVS